MPPRVVKCPQCNADVPWTPESKWRPFCSERCKTIDLGAWASERYRIETPEAPDNADGPSDARRDER
ncbi:MAG TPA: DNA gyrase inhibitor YacG [Casimicrobiaceae bacterium]|nr:DNA gyrase inhibitor YacG [Casimicrobiaceae bacterium]